MKTTVKNYTNSELFTLANKIRRESGCTKAEAYHKAKNQLEAPAPKKMVTHRQKYSGVKITERLKSHTLNKYGLKVGEVYPSVKALSDKMHVSVQNIYGYIRMGVLVLV